ncbi:unnamed protein product [Ectocarpus sp. 12 AP-2014]
MMRPSKLQENWTPVHITRLEHTTTSSPSANERQLATATGCRHNRTKTRNNPGGLGDWPSAFDMTCSLTPMVPCSKWDGGMRGSAQPQATSRPTEQAAVVEGYNETSNTHAS